MSIRYYDEQDGLMTGAGRFHEIGSGSRSRRGGHPVRPGWKALPRLGPRSHPLDERPRERLEQNGPRSLSDQELLAILLNTGVEGKNVNELAHEILDLIDRGKDAPTIEELQRITGMGKAKSCLIAATLEFGRRRWGIRGARIRHPSDVYPLIRHYASCRQERFIGISLSGAHEALAVRVITMGLVNQTIAHPREVFADVIADRANACIVAHNHPSGSLQPSVEDDALTARLLQAGNILGIRLLDHLIFTEDSYYSYSQDKKLT